MASLNKFDPEWELGWIIYILVANKLHFSNMFHLLTFQRVHDFVKHQRAHPDVPSGNKTQIFNFNID